MFQKAFIALATESKNNVKSIRLEFKISDIFKLLKNPAFFTVRFFMVSLKNFFTI